MGWWNDLFGKSPDYQGMAQSLADNTIDSFTLDQCIAKNKQEEKKMSITDWQMQQDIKNDYDKANKPGLRQFIDSETLKQKLTLTHPLQDLYRVFPVKYQSDKLLVIEYNSEDGVVEQTFDIQTWEGIYPVHVVDTKPALNSMILTKSPCMSNMKITDILKRKIHHVVVSVQTKIIVGFIIQRVNGDAKV